MTTVRERLAALKLDLDRVRYTAAGSYVAAREAGGLLYLSGHGPLLDGKPQYVGRVPSEVTVPEAYDAARLTALNCLATIEAAAGSLERVAGFVKLLGMVNADPSFREHPRVLDGASDLLVEVFGDLGAHARSAVGMASLPFGIPVEIELIVQLR